MAATGVAHPERAISHDAPTMAKAWYRQFDFEESPTDPLHLMLLLDDLRRGLNG